MIIAKELNAGNIMEDSDLFDKLEKYLFLHQKDSRFNDLKNRYVETMWAISNLFNNISTVAQQRSFKTHYYLKSCLYSVKAQKIGGLTQASQQKLLIMSAVFFGLAASIIYYYTASTRSPN